MLFRSLLDADNNIKIVDFGLSNRYKPYELLQTACGSPCYAAPEMILGKKYHGPTVDVWSLGVILFAIICGYLPFEEENTSKLYKKVLSCEYKIPSYISEEGKDLLRCILRTNPDLRYTLSQIKEHKWLEHESILIKNLSLKNSLTQFIPRINNKVVTQMAKYGFTDQRKIASDIKNNHHNRLTVTYYLLQTKVLTRMRDIEKKFSMDIKNSIQYETIDSDISSTLNELENSFSFTNSSFYIKKVDIMNHKKSGSISYSKNIHYDFKGKNILQKKQKTINTKKEIENKEVDNIKKMEYYTSRDRKAIINEKEIINKPLTSNPVKKHEDLLKLRYTYINSDTNPIFSNCKFVYNLDLNNTKTKDKKDDYKSRYNASLSTNNKCSENTEIKNKDDVSSIVLKCTSIRNELKSMLSALHQENALI